jgi:hypothetical protein
MIKLPNGIEGGVNVVTPDQSKVNTPTWQRILESRAAKFALAGAVMASIYTPNAFAQSNPRQEQQTEPTVILRGSPTFSNEVEERLKKEGIAIPNPQESKGTSRPVETLRLGFKKFDQYIQYKKTGNKVEFTFIGNPSNANREIGRRKFIRVVNSKTPNVVINEIN